MLRRFFACLALAGIVIASHPARAEFKLGIGTAVTGPVAPLGDQLKRGVDQAVADINAKGGIKGEKIVTVVGDDSGDPKQGISVANKLIGENIKFIVGHLTSGVSIATSKEYAEAGVMMISPTATNPRFTEEGSWNVFRSCGRDDQQGIVAGEYIVKHLKDKKIAIIHDREPYGQGLAEEARKVMNAGGVKEVLYDGINPGEKDFSALVSRMKQLNVDYLYFGGYHPEAGLIIRQMRDQGMSTAMIGPDSLIIEEFVSIAGSGAEGTLLTFSADPRKNPAAKPIVDAFRAKGIDPEGFTLYSYAAVQVIAEGVEASGSLDPRKVAEFIRTSGHTFNTVVGPLTFDKKGDITKPTYVMYEWKKDSSGKYSYTEKLAAGE